MKKLIRNCSLKLWLTVVGISFLLFQLPLYYIYYGTIHYSGSSYGVLLTDFTKNWLIMVILLSVPCFVVFRLVRRLYQPYWSTRGFKLALLLVSEFVMLFFLLIYFSVYTSNYIIPTGPVLAVFVLSYAIAVYAYKYRSMEYLLHKEHEERE